MAVQRANQLRDTSQLIERNLAAELLTDPQHLWEVYAQVEPGDMHDPLARAIYNAVLARSRAAQPIDITAISVDLMPMGYSAAEISEMLKTAMEQSSGMASALLAMRQLVVRRQIQQASRQLQQLLTAPFDEIKTGLSAVQEALMELATGKHVEQSWRYLPEFGSAYADRLQAAEDNAVKTGIPTLDLLTGGLQRGSLMFLAARPGVGKTSLAMQIALQIGYSGRSGIFFSAEMPWHSVMQRIAAAKLHIPMADLHRKQVDIQRLEAELAKLPPKIALDDRSNISLDYIYGICRRIQAEQGGLDLVVIDYAQLIVEPERYGDHSGSSLTRVANGLKQIARQMDCPVIALTQLARDADDGQKPQMRHLFGSSGQEHAADIVAVLWSSADQREKSTSQIVYLTCSLLKNRQGPLGEMALRFNLPFQYFEDLGVAGGATG